MSLNGSTKSLRKKATTDLTIGDPLKVILLFAVPVYLSNIFQQFYNLTDVAIIGHKLGDDALSAIGSVSIIYGLFNSLAFGMGNGFSIVISKYFGAGKPKELKKAVFNTLAIAIVWSILLTIAGCLSLRPLMKLLNTPDSIFDSAYSYAQILLALIVLPFAYNVLSGMLRAIGNSRAPLYFLMISVMTNIVLDLLFVYGLDKGLPGAAIATALSQALSSTICLIYILLKVPELHFSREDMVLSRTMISDLFSAGISFAMMFTVVNVGTVVLQRAINGFGEDTIAAHTTARKISELCMMMVGTMATAMATFAGQNYGAGKFDRIREGLKKTLFCSFAIASVLIIFIYTLGGLMVRLISGSSNSDIIDTATFYLKVDLPFYYVLAVVLITRSTLQGVGSKLAPIVASLMELLLKVFTAGWLAKKLGYTGIAVCEPIVWTVCAIYILIVFFNNKDIKKSSPHSGVQTSEPET